MTGDGAPAEYFTAKCYSLSTSCARKILDILPPILREVGAQFYQCLSPFVCASSTCTGHSNICASLPRGLPWTPSSPLSRIQSTLGGAPWEDCWPQLRRRRGDAERVLVAWGEVEELPAFFRTVSVVCSPVRDSSRDGPCPNGYRNSKFDVFLTWRGTFRYECSRAIACCIW